MDTIHIRIITNNDDIIEVEEEEEDSDTHDVEDDATNEHDHDNAQDHNDEQDVSAEQNDEDEYVTMFVPEEIIADHEVEVLPAEVEIEYNDNPFEFNHCWKQARVNVSPYNFQPVFELDDLPDPRLYNIDVGLLYELAQQRGDEFDPNYENYLALIEPKVYERAMRENYTINVNYEKMRHLKFFNCSHSERNFRKPNPIMFFPPVLSLDGATRSKQIHKALNKFIVRLEWHIECSTKYDTLDNVHWGIVSGEPHPKPAWMRYIRWRRYFIHLKLSGINHLSPKYDLTQYGPPNLRPIDLERMSLTNCFALDVQTGQYSSCSTGCFHENSPLPQFPDVNDRSIVLYQYKSIWLMNINEKAAVTLWMGYFRQQTYPCSLRVERINVYLDHRYPVWGRTNHYHQTTSGHQDVGWTMIEDDGFKNGWDDDETQAKKQKRDN